MATLQLQSSFDTSSRPHSHQGIPTMSPSESPQIQRPSSQASLHLPPSQPTLQSPALTHEQPFSAHIYSALPYKPFQPNGLPAPSAQHFMSGYPPNTAPPMAFYPTSIAPMYDPRSTPMMRTISHAHPLNSANDQTVSSRYSSPHSANNHGIDGPASASAPSYKWQLNTPALSVQQPEERHNHINPSVFNNNSYPMSRSTSGASDIADVQRLLTPHYEYREQLSPGAADLRKVSDSLGGYTSRRYNGIGHLDRYTPAPQPAGMYPQPTGQFWGRDTAVDQGYQHFGSDREKQQYQQQQQQHEMPMIPENDYERERMELISGNRKLMETLGLGGGGSQPFRRPARQMSTSDLRSRKPSTPKKRIANYDGQVRSSPRIASQHRSVSYMDLDGAPGSEHSDDSYSDEAIYEEDDLRPTKRGRGHKQVMSRKTSAYGRPRKQVELSLWGLLQVYPQIPDLFPLFYYTLNNDLSINSDSVPLIGSIPSTVTPVQKSDMLRGYFHRGRRVLAQLDCFTSRCDRKYEGPEERWPELEHHTRIAIRDVRRKIVERCENYKYTRRDILDKNMGKGKWHAIENGMIEWRFGVTVSDPAEDLANVTLTLPTPPPGMLIQQQQQQQLVPDYHTQRVIRPMPSQNRVPSSAPRSVSINMADSGSVPSYPGTAMSMPTYSAHYGAAAPSPAPPMYGEDQVPMTVQMPGMRDMPSLSPMPQQTPVMSTSVDLRMSVGVNTPLLVMSSPPDGGLEVVGSESMPSASSGLSSVPQSGVKRERSAESGEVSE